MPSNSQNNKIWTNENYRTIFITGGTDVSDASLISWLEQNATQEDPSNPRLVDLEQLGSDLESIADAIRTINSGSGKLAFPDGFLTELNRLPMRYQISVTQSISTGSFRGNRTIVDGGKAKIKITPPSSNYDVSSLTITGASYTYSSSSRIITLTNPTQNILIHIEWGKTS